MIAGEQYVKLPDGRQLAYAESGDPHGRPVLYCHGTPSTSAEWRLWDAGELTARLGLRVITVDRPGVGGSDYQAERRVNDWPADVAALANHLRLDRFSVLGYSGGCPYAAACAALLPEQVTQVVLVGVVGPFDKPGLVDAMTPRNRQLMEACRDRPRLGRLLLRLMLLLARLAPRRTVQQAVAALPPPDQHVLEREDRRRLFLELIRDAQRAGPRGAQHDLALMASPWDFDLSAISAPTLLWHGGADQNATVAMARYLEAAIPGSKLHLQAHDGHLSIVTRHARTILQAVAGDTAAHNPIEVPPTAPPPRA
jgi:pimeloyl-ACP methyl ester carboxylesterase